VLTDDDVQSLRNFHNIVPITFNLSVRDLKKFLLLKRNGEEVFRLSDTDGDGNTVLHRICSKKDAQGMPGKVSQVLREMKPDEITQKNRLGKTARDVFLEVSGNKLGKNRMAVLKLFDEYTNPEPNSDTLELFQINLNQAPDRQAFIRSVLCKRAKAKQELNTFFQVLTDDDVQSLRAGDTGPITFSSDLSFTDIKKFLQLKRNGEPVFRLSDTDGEGNTVLHRICTDQNSQRLLRRITPILKGMNQDEINQRNRDGKTARDVLFDEIKKRPGRGSTMVKIIQLLRQYKAQ
jgi:hypothetical protein